MKRMMFVAACLISFSIMAQSVPGQQNFDTAWKKIYRASYPKNNELVNTKLEVRFDIPKSIMYGKAWLTLRPHFYPTDSLTLDAKYMDIKEIAIVKGLTKTKLNYSYDSLQLHIKLDKTYKGGEKYDLYVDYISRPEDVKSEGSAAITEAKGLYFINPDGKGEWPTQIWTQGETEANSVWMPTIDKPDQKTTQEISMTVPDKYMTLSNGLMTSQKKNADGTRTDTWKLEQPNSPYLFFMGVMGKNDFAVVKDQYKNIPVDYYVEKEYASVAKRIFGETPRMMEFFSTILKFPYVWPKYAQMVGREYVSGAMENTTATLHQDGAYQNARQLVDGNRWESTIAHELFHHWFGDLVTAESWSNITLNESFADYSQYLWEDYRHGRDAADQSAFEEMQGYLMSNSSNKDLVRFYYRDKEDVFDAVSYNKGGRILHMLRTVVGDDAFFSALNKYLTDHKYQPAEAQQLRLAFEAVTGKDMNWFWNEWYYGAGEPHLTINYQYENGKERVIVNQTQKENLFNMPVNIDVYSSGNKKETYKVWIRNASDTFYFPSIQKPSWVNFDADKALLTVKNDQKTMEEFEQQYKYGPKYLDRREALEYFAAKGSNNLAWGLKDKFSGLRLLTLELIPESKLASDPSIIPAIEQIAEKDTHKKTQAAALSFLAQLKNPKYKNLFQKFVGDSSYSVAGASLSGLAELEPDMAYSLAKKYSNDAKDDLGIAVSDILFKNGTEADFKQLLNIYTGIPASQGKVSATTKFASYLEKLQNPSSVKEGVGAIMEFRNQIPTMYQGYFDPGLKQLFARLAQAQSAKGNTEVANYIKNLLP